MSTQKIAESEAVQKIAEANLGVILVKRDPSGGVEVEVRGLDEKHPSVAWVARVLVHHANGLFADGQPVLMAGDADPMLGVAGWSTHRVKSTAAGVSAPAQEVQHVLSICEYRMVERLAQGESFSLQLFVATLTDAVNARRAATGHQGQAADLPAGPGEGRAEQEHLDRRDDAGPQPAKNHDPRGVERAGQAGQPGFGSTPLRPCTVDAGPPRCEALRSLHGECAERGQDGAPCATQCSFATGDFLRADRVRSGPVVTLEDYLRLKGPANEL